MSLEFTGERVIPGLTESSLWNEHLARYLFAARLSRRRRVLDLACGSGYGSAELARQAECVTAVDIAPDAVLASRNEYANQKNIRWSVGDAQVLPFRDQAFDLVVAFEVIEHLRDQVVMVAEAKRVLAPGGQLVVSTPNRLFYTESRNTAGPNPFHTREFDFGEFKELLESFFPHVSLFLEDHAEGILVQAAHQRGPTEVRFGESLPDPNDANFFVAVCALTPQTGAPAFLYLPSTANLLRERWRHIEMLNEQLAESRSEHQTMVRKYDQLEQEVEQKNAWARQLNDNIDQAAQRIRELDAELVEQRTGFQSKIASLEGELRQANEWAQGLERDVADRDAQVVQESSRAERAESQVQVMLASRWVRLGRKLGVGPGKAANGAS